MYFPELARGRETERKIQKEHDIEHRKQTEANKIIKRKCGNSNSVIENIVDIILCTFERIMTEQRRHIKKQKLFLQNQEKKASLLHVTELPFWISVDCHLRERV